MRYVVAILAVLLVLGILGGLKGAQIASLVGFGKKAAQAGPPPETVATGFSRDAEWESTLSDVGSVAARKGVTVSSEASGILTRLHFESGERVKQGDAIAELDTNVERSQLASVLARRELAETTIRRTQSLVASGSIPEAQLDTDRAQLQTADKDADALRAQIGHKIVRAPFGGRLGIRRVNLGQFLPAGTPITILETVESVFVDFTTPQERLPSLKIGTPVRIALARDGSAARTGAIEAIEPAVDQTTRTVRVRATIPNEDEVMRTGMFVRVTVVLPTREHVVIVPTTTIVHAAYGDSVYVVEDKPPNAPGMRTTPDGKPVRVARQQFVKTGETRGDFIVVEEGVKAGQELVVAGTFKLRNGAPVVVNNEVQPKPELSPHPQNR
jgi:membrane fusion protein (multidrug efflux system)